MYNVIIEGSYLLSITTVLLFFRSEPGINYLTRRACIYMYTCHDMMHMYK